MIQNWSTEEKLQYDAVIDKQMRRGSLLISLLCLGLFPLCTFLDFFTQRVHYEELTTLRVYIVMFYMVMVLYILKFYQTHRPLLMSVLMLGAASFGVTLTSLVTGGFNSPYYTGVGLVAIGALLVCPLDAKKMAPLFIFLVAIYFVGCMTKYHPGQMTNIINNLYTLGMTGIIGVSSCYIAEKMRQDSFDHFLQARRAQEELKLSQEMLQLELHSEQTNVASLVKEITERKNELENALTLAEKTRQEAQHALQVRQEFISLASHELNTPITSLQLQTQLLLRKLTIKNSFNQDEVNSLLHHYNLQIKRIARTVRDMLDISRMNDGGIELHKNAVDLEFLIKDVIVLAQGLGPTEIHFKSSGPVVGVWDGPRIEQVVLNLLTNALKFGEGKPIEVELRQNDQGVEIIVRDQGIGIAKEEQERIFNRFERAITGVTYSGLGLGLYLARNIVHAHGGGISVESAPKMGARFTVELPA